MVYFLRKVTKRKKGNKICAITYLSLQINILLQKIPYDN